MASHTIMQMTSDHVIMQTMFHQERESPNDSSLIFAIAFFGEETLRFIRYYVWSWRARARAPKR